MTALIQPNRQVDYKLETQILTEVKDLVQTVQLHLLSDGYTGPSSIRRCIELRRKRMTTIIGKRVARDIIKHREPLVAVAFIIESYLPEFRNETHNLHDESGGSETPHR
jgi:hypothetical protein